MMRYKKQIKIFFLGLVKTSEDCQASQQYVIKILTQFYSQSGPVQGSFILSGCSTASSDLT